MTRTEKIETRSVTVVRATCDLCGHEASGDGIDLCIYCGKDYCRKCREQWEHDPWTGDDYGDYWQSVCKECNAKIQQYSERAAYIRERADDEIGALEVQWKRDCKKHKQENE